MSAARVVVVGAGYFAPFHVEGWRACGAEVVALVDRDRARAEALASRHGIDQAGIDLARVLDATRADIVDLVVPPDAQAALVHAALERRIPTICQKPFGRDLADATALAALARRVQVPLVVHENFRFSPWYRACRRLVDEGRLGRLYGVSFRLRPGDGQGPHAYLDRQPAFRTMPRLLVRETGVHFVDTFRFLLGEVRAVSARLRRLNPAVAGEDAGIVVFEFDDERTGVLDANRLVGHAGADARLTMGELWLEGEAGVLRLDGDARLWFTPHGGRERAEPYGGVRPGPFGGAVAALQAHVLAHLREGHALENDASAYLANLRVQDAIYASHTGGCRVELPPSAPPEP